MREILFKAKRVDNREWVEGLLWKKKYNDGNRIFISCFPDKDDNEEVYVVCPETLSQFTGLCDKNGNRIWENDIIRDDFVCFWRTERTLAVVKFGEGHYDSGIYPFAGWYYEYIDDKNIDGQALYEKVAKEDFEVIGNIFDNADLLTAD